MADLCEVGPCANWLKVGDRLSFYRDTNWTRRVVSRIVDDRCVELEVFLRPSKGFRRHVRRVKSSRRIVQ